MKVSSENLSSFFIIEVLGVDLLPFLPSLHLSVEVNDEGFSGSNREVWVETDGLEQFLADLKACEQSRRGKAHLSSMSPDEFELTIESFDGWGHFALTYKISKVFFGVAQAKSVLGWFDLDSSLFGQMVSDFADLLLKS